METAYLTQERYNELVKELEELKVRGRAEVAEHLKQAKELGDLSENSEYQEVREEQARLEQKIQQIEDLLRHSSIIKKSAGGVVEIGSKVKVKRNDRDVESNNGVMVFTIVGSPEADPTKGFISNQSPIGKGMLGEKVGSVFYVETPKGKACYQILSID